MACFLVADHNYSTFMVVKDSSLRAFQPRYQKVKQWLMEQLKANSWQKGERIPGESILARNLDVSTITVRQALNELARDGYLRRVRGRGTFVEKEWPRTSVAGLASGHFEKQTKYSSLKSLAVGILLPDGIEIKFRERQIIEALERAVTAREGRTVVLRIATEDEGIQLQSWIDQIDGLSVLVFFEFEGIDFGWKVLPRLHNKGLPIIAYEYLGAFCLPRVIEDRWWAMWLAIEHLKSLGHRKIALAGFNMGKAEQGLFQWVSVRYQAFLEVCHRQGLPVSVEDIFTADLGTRDWDAQRAAGSLAVERILNSDESYTAIVGVNDIIALGMLYEITRRSLPISVLGFDNIPEAGLENLTTLSCPPVEVGEALVKLVEVELAGSWTCQNSYPQVVVRPQIIHRNSTRSR